MVCPRCGAVFEGNFCPTCGTPAPAAAPVAPAPAYRGTCPRCGTAFVGNYCPRCGLPAGWMAYAPPRSSAGRSFLSVLWTIAITGFLILVALDLAGLLVGPSLVVPGAQGIASGGTTNPEFRTDSSGWSFMALSPFASGAYVASGGNPDGYLGMSLPPGSNAGGMWTQAVSVTGSMPFAVRLRLDALVAISGSTGTSGRLIAALDASAGTPDYAHATTVGWYNASTGTWIQTLRIDLSERAPTTGTYYLKLAFLAAPNGGTTTVGLDNVRLDWITDAAVYFYLPLPLPTILFVSQDPALFLAYYGFLVAAIALACLYYSIRERKLFLAALFAPFEQIGARLRSMSAWVAIAQTWLAVTFVQVAIILVLEAIGPPPSSPITATAGNVWVLLFELANASVYEELVFRALLIGVPLALGSLALNAGLARRRTPQGGSARRSLHYLVGGNLRATSSRESLLAAWVLLFASSALFGLAHAPGWGWWKVVPAMVAGLGFGYLFLRHGVGAAIIAHFATNYVSALSWEGVGGVPLDILVGLLFFVLAIAGSGFLGWYVIYAFEQARDLWRRFTSHPIRQPASVGGGQVPPAAAYASPPPGWPAPPGAPPPPTAGYGPPPTWPAPPQAASVLRDPNQVPREYTPTYRPPVYGYPPVRFQCPSCGWVEATYDNGHFTCRRCGRTA